MRSNRSDVDGIQKGNAAHAGAPDRNHTMIKHSLSLFAALLLAACAAAPPPPQPMTDWRITAASGMDAVLLIGVASGDKMQAELYPEEVDWVQSALPPPALAALGRIDARIRGDFGQLTGPALAFFFSAGPIATLDDVIDSANDPHKRLRPALEASPHWSAAQFEAAVALMPDVALVLGALHEAGYEDWYDRRHRPSVRAAAEALRSTVASYDLVPEHARLLGRELDPTIEMLVLAFSRPYGIRLLGQRYASWHGWEPETQLRVAAHELFHPPYDPRDQELTELLAELEADPWMQSIVTGHDPQYGYNSFAAIVDEDSTQALEQVVAERLGFAEDPRERWRQSDDGMHMLAAALYHAMREDRFGETGGRYADWLKSALRRGLLTPQQVRERASAIVGADAVARWPGEAE